MKFLECGVLTLASACGGVGMGLGYRWAGFPGVPVGGVLGIVCGLVIGGGAIAGVFWVGTVLERLSKHMGLYPYLGRYWGRRHAPAWTDLKERLAAGKPVRGKVVLVRKYGRFIDLGVGFPAVLKTVDDGRVQRQMPELHTEVEALVLEFDDREREVVLTRRDRWLLVSDGVTVGYLVGNPPILEDGRAAYFPITHRAHAAFREQLERGETVSCQLLPPSKAVRRVRVEKAEWLIRIHDVPDDGAPSRTASGLDDGTRKSP
ncbi:hypothetical protein [Pyxidicoccus sp. MSG2]|uniref:hypothetical protein n=1 Tax=Pyxidicoccus sp. MSG2 TaxID=2996790 RepID=UPI00226FD9D9|nr:hypothetical protein [Pyxidicoccus sp. MSG2]MCY1022912.1 hypothetical protein [Pyxidicoccus sp. MSG2]